MSPFQCLQPDESEFYQLLVPVCASRIFRPSQAIHKRSVLGSAQLAHALDCEGCQVSRGGQRSRSVPKKISDRTLVARFGTLGLIFSRSAAITRASSGWMNDNNDELAISTTHDTVPIPEKLFSFC